MRNIIMVVTAIATLGMLGCATPRDLSKMEANVNTAAAGKFGTCMAAVHTGAVQLGKAQSVLKEGQANNSKLSDSNYEEGMQASEDAVRARRQAEEACLFQVVQVEKQLQRTKEVLRGVTFVVGSARLTQGARATLEVVGNRLLREPTRVEIQGHTSSTGSLEVNMKLSQERADAVRNFLISQGVTADSLSAKGYGPTEPVASNDTPEGRRANQRVELQYLK